MASSSTRSRVSRLARPLVDGAEKVLPWGMDDEAVGEVGGLRGCLRRLVEMTDRYRVRTAALEAGLDRRWARSDANPEAHM